MSDEYAATIGSVLSQASSDERPTAPDASPAATIKALLAGPMTPDKRDVIIEWLNHQLNPDHSAPSPKMRTTVQLASDDGRRPDPAVTLALGMLGRGYPEAAMMSPTAQMDPSLDYNTLAARGIHTGGLLINPVHVPANDQANDPAGWSRSFAELLNTLRHEYAHGMGLPDEGASPTAYDVGHVSSRLHQDIELPAATKGKR